MQGTQGTKVSALILSWRLAAPPSEAWFNVKLNLTNNPNLTGNSLSSFQTFGSTLCYQLRYHLFPALTPDSSTVRIDCHICISNNFILKGPKIIHVISACDTDG
jgi:hypothetical protein